MHIPTFVYNLIWISLRLPNVSQQKLKFQWMNKIFISYRRSDFYETERLVTSLKNEFGQDNIFLDSESLNAGDEWPDTIQNNIADSKVLVIIIGKNWLFMQDEFSGKRKIDMHNDWVRKEIHIFLQRCENNKNLYIIPVLINGAKMPRKEHLDPQINHLCDFQAIELPNTLSSLDFVQIKNILVKYEVYNSEPLEVVTHVGPDLPNPLTKEDEESFLLENKLWQIRERNKAGVIGQPIRELHRVFEFKNYDEAWKFMCIIDRKGIKPHNHHPRWQNTYNRVEVWLCIFNIGHKPSGRDLRLATIMENIWKEFALSSQ